MPTSGRLPALLTLSLTFTLPAVLRADPIRITSGHVQVETGIAAARIAVAGTGFSVTVGTEGFVSALQFCSPCEPGVPITLGSTWTPGDLPSGTATLGGTTFSNVFFGPGTSWSFVTAPVTLTGSAPISVSLPFTFSGNITGFATSDLNDPAFSASLFGTGIARALFVPVLADGVPLFSVTELPGTDFKLEYTFSDAAATPEPATLVLLASGMVALGAQRRQARRGGSIAGQA